MTDYTGLPVSGYRPQNAAAVALVNEFKADEERLLRKLDWLAQQHPEDANRADLRWVAIARTHLEQGFMALNRSIFQPGRAPLPEGQSKLGSQ